MLEKTITVGDKQVKFAKLRHLLKNGHENSPDFSEHEKSTGC